MECCRWKVLLLFVILFFSGAGYAQRPEEAKNSFDREKRSVEQAIQLLEHGLIKKDTSALKALLHEELNMGHSNSWIENKKELLDHIAGGYLNYREIEPQGRPEIDMENGAARVRRQIRVKVDVKEQQVEMLLSVLEIWLRHEDGWKLWGRQSVAVNN